MYSYNLKQSRKNANYCYVDGKRVKKVHFDLIALYAIRKDSFLSDSKSNYHVCYLPFEYTSHLEKIWLTGNYIEFYVYQPDFDDMPISGACDYVVEQMASKAYIQKQLADKQDKIVKELAQYGAWDESELQDNQVNIQRLLWVMISDYKEQLFLSEGE